MDSAGGHEPDRATGYQVVYKAHPENVSAVVESLRSHRLHPLVLDQPGPIMQYAAKGTYTVRVAVPAEEAREAAVVLAELDKQAEATVEQFDRAIRRRFFEAMCLFVVILLGARLLLGRMDGTVIACSAASAVAVVVAWRKRALFWRQGGRQG